MFRKELNRRALKHSKNPKHQKIREKLEKLERQGWETEDLTDEEIMNIANRFPTLDVRIVAGGYIIVKSIKDTWVIDNEGDCWVLYHRELGIKKGKIAEKSHLQDIFYDLEFAFASIVSHDDWAVKGIARSMQEIMSIATFGVAPAF